MGTRYFVLVVIAGLVMVAGGKDLPGQSTPKIKQVQIRPSPPESGSGMFREYCAVCHGADGKGGGPASAALKTPPTALTTLTIANGGKFPADKVSAILSGQGQGTPAHGSREMPIWGTVFRSLESPSSAVIGVKQRIANLTRYLESIQE